MQESIKVIESDVYTNYINFIENKVVLKILDKYRENAAIRDSDKMNKANVSASSIIDILTNDKDKFTAYVFSKIKKYENVKFKEDYPEGEEPEEEDNNEQILGYAKGFILLYAIEYYVLKHNPDSLEAYIKECKIPQASKYTKELKQIYRKL
ncbi:hypothetical protein [Ulvibacter litoralis]|uniref:Uncharacterized protein n=1 Tax=Ulvibacter litoralis TaxID=227084 RepID=A0A1G7HEA9_9FLAO|nr:hypothetical protein [Ulvibacter litoralis]GHC57480.1 hypothetical protein GCM10008083_22550 [Ulvibacter litoralis]SDE98701.1 hypothetical protein SAMN05421855_10441 [Ulvibacter litoralis]